MMVYVGASSGTYRFGVNSVYCYGTSFCIRVEQTNNPKEVTDDEAGWIITVPVRKTNPRARGERAERKDRKSKSVK